MMAARASAFAYTSEQIQAICDFVEAETGRQPVTELGALLRGVVPALVQDRRESHARNAEQISQWPEHRRQDLAAIDRLLAQCSTYAENKTWIDLHPEDSAVRRTAAITEQLQAPLRELRAIAVEAIAHAERSVESHKASAPKSAERPFQRIIFEQVRRVWVQIGGKPEGFRRFFALTVRPVLQDPSVQQITGCIWTENLLKTLMSGRDNVQNIRPKRGRPPIRPAST
jgi:hypothetical protein